MELYDIGKHCNYKYCKQLDYLPFYCNGCDAHYCLEHKVVSYHEDCKLLKQEIVVICTKCDSYLGKVKEIDEKQTLLNQHSNQGCIKKTKILCNVKKCKDKRNKVTCSACRNTFCLNHRFQESHNCTYGPMLSPVTVH